MLQFLTSRIVYVIAGAVLVAGLILLKRLLARSKEKKQQREMFLLQRRNDALNETLSNPKVKNPQKSAVAPVEVKWDEKAVDSKSSGVSTPVIELVEISAYSRRKHLFPASQPISIGSSAENQMVLMREGIAEKHCEIFMKNGAIAARNLSGEQAVLVRGKVTALISEEGVYLNNGDHIRLGNVDIQFRHFKA